MLTIDQQIEILQKKKLKIEVFNQVLDLAKNMKIDDNDIKDRVITELTKFIEGQINNIQFGEQLVTATKIEVKKSEDTTQTSALKIEPKQEDKLSAHMRLINRKVRIKGSNGEIQDGLIVGVDAPMVVVKLENGKTLETNMAKIIA